MIYDLNEEYIDDVGTQCGKRLREGSPVALEFEPGNGTRYELVLTPCRSIIQAGGSATPTGFGGDLVDVVVVTYINNPAAYGFKLLGRPEPPHINYIGEKLRCSDEDAEAFRLLFAAIGASS